jgi:hypothetical protein
VVPATVIGAAVIDPAAFDVVDLFAAGDLVVCEFRSDHVVLMSGSRQRILAEADPPVGRNKTPVDNSLSAVFSSDRP